MGAKLLDVDAGGRHCQRGLTIVMRDCLSAAASEYGWHYLNSTHVPLAMLYRPRQHLYVLRRVVLVRT